MNLCPRLNREIQWNGQYLCRKDEFYFLPLKLTWKMSGWHTWADEGADILTEIFTFSYTWWMWQWPNGEKKRMHEHRRGMDRGAHSICVKQNYKILREKGASYQQHQKACLCLQKHTTYIHGADNCSRFWFWGQRAVHLCSRKSILRCFSGHQAGLPFSKQCLTFKFIINNNVLVSPAWRKNPE